MINSHNFEMRQTSLGVPAEKIPFLKKAYFNRK